MSKSKVDDAAFGVYVGSLIGALLVGIALGVMVLYQFHFSDAALLKAKLEATEQRVKIIEAEDKIKKLRPLEVKAARGECRCGHD